MAMAITALLTRLHRHRLFTHTLRLINNHPLFHNLLLQDPSGLKVDLSRLFQLHFHLLLLFSQTLLALVYFNLVEGTLA